MCDQFTATPCESVYDEFVRYEIDYHGQPIVNVEIHNDGVVVYASVSGADRVQVLAWT